MTAGLVVDMETSLRGYIVTRDEAFWDLLRGKKSWGDMQRRGFQTAPVDQVSKSN